MRAFQLSLLCSVAFGVNLASLTLPINLTRVLLAPAAAQPVEVRKAEADQLLLQGIQQYQASQFQEALQLWEQALQAYRGVNDRSGEAYVLNNLGEAYRSLSQYSKAIEYYQQALPLFRALDDSNGEAMTLNNWGLAYFSLSQYQKAIDYHQQAMLVYQTLGDRNGQATALVSLGITHTELGQYQQAIEFGQQALLIYQALDNSRGEAIALANLGFASLALNQYQQAIEYYQQALPLTQGLHDRDGEATVTVNLGIAYSALNQPQKAIEYYQQVLPIFQQIGNRDGEAKVLANLGNVYLSLEQLHQAIEYYQRALPIYRTIGNLKDEANILNNIGFSFLKLNQYTAAEKILSDALVILQSIRDPNLSDTNRISLFDTQAATYMFLQQALIAQNTPEKNLKALEVSEQARARSLVESLSNRLAQSNLTISSSAPDLAGIRRIAQQQNVTLVQYSVIDTAFGDPALYIWIVKPSGEISFQSVDLSQLQQPLADLVTFSRTAIGARGRSDDATIAVRLSPAAQQKQDAEQKQVLKQLYQLLIQPIKSDLPTNVNDHVVFIPQGNLFLVPFAALLDDNNSYLIEQHTLFTAPSIQVLDLARQSSQPLGSLDPNQVLVVGNPTMPKVWNPNRSEQTQLPSLPGSEAEAEAIAQQFGTQPLLSDQATEATVTQRMQTAQIIHLATHGLLDYGDPDESGVLDAPGAIALAADASHDGLLTARELYQMNLKADLVVLSACDTGRGRITGDGVVGLSRSLIQAGVPSLVVSLWKVPDESTAYLMRQFYQNLQNSLDKAQALRQAMLETMQKYPEPIHWAAFTLIGEAD